MNGENPWALTSESVTIQATMMGGPDADVLAADVLAANTGRTWTTRVVRRRSWRERLFSRPWRPWKPWEVRTLDTAIVGFDPDRGTARLEVFGVAEITLHREKP